MSKYIECMFENEGMNTQQVAQYVFLKEMVKLFAKIIEKGETERGAGYLRKGQSVQTAYKKRAES